MARETYTATVESGECKEFARLDLGEVHLWLYPQPDGTVTVETEEKY